MSSTAALAPLPPGPGRLASLRAYGRNPATYFQAILPRYGDVLRWRGYMDMYLLNNPDDVRTVLTQAWPRYTKRNIDYRVLRKLAWWGYGAAIVLLVAVLVDLVWRRLER